MRTTFLSLFSLFVSCFFLFLANGLINVLLPVRMGLDNVSTDTIGMVLSLYFVGLLLGALFSINLIKRAGHIRMFAGCVTLGAISILICSLFSETLLWGAMRVVLGFCNACAFTALESWLSSSSSKNTRGKILAVYNAVVLGGLFGGQFLMNLAKPQDTTLFVLSGILLCAAVLPLLMSKHAGPVVEEVTTMSLRALFKISPLGVVTCLVSGAIYSAAFNLLPIFANEYNIVDFQLSLYIGTAIFGAFLLQFPVGLLSDKYDRRTVLFSLLMISALVDIAMPTFALSEDLSAIFIGTAITCGIISCTYPLSISEVFDKLRHTEMVAGMGCMILVFSVGGIIGPYTASVVMSAFGGISLFYFLGVIQLLLAIFVIYRITMRKALPADEQENFVMQGSAFSSIIELDPRIDYIETVQPVSAEMKTILSVAKTNPAAAIKLVQEISKTNPVLALDIAKAMADIPNIDVLRLYEVMKEAIPNQVIDITRELAMAKPEMAYEILNEFSDSDPMKVELMAAEIGRDLPELRAQMAKIAMEAAPDSAVQVAEYYAEILAEEREEIRPIDRDEDTSEEDIVNLVSELWQGDPEHAINVAVAMVDAVPEAAVPLAEEYMVSQYNEPSEEECTEEVLTSDEKTTEEQCQDSIELVSRLAESAPEQAVDIAVAVLEVIPDSASEIVDAISAGEEAESGEWMNLLKDKPTNEEG
jgi:MFS family permease